MDKVKVYRNLHKGCFSVVDWKTKRVARYTDKILLGPAQFRVSEKGRQRVLQEKRENIHAYVIGIVLPLHKLQCEMEEVYYNPYTTDSFIRRETGKRIYESDFVYLIDNKVYVRKDN